MEEKNLNTAAEEILKATEDETTATEAAEGREEKTETQENNPKQERPEVEDKGNKTYSVDGKMLLDDINDVFELALDTENCDTIGGWIYAQIDYPPKVGQKVKTPEAEFTIEEIAKMRITRVKIQLIHEPENIHEDIQEEYPDDVK